MRPCGNDGNCPCVCNHSGACTGCSVCFLVAAGWFAPPPPDDEGGEH